MAEPVIVPVQLDVDVTDIDMSTFKPKDVQKAISSSLSGVRKSVEQVFSKIDPSKATKPLLTGIQSIEGGLIKLNNIQASFNKEVIRIGKSTDAYKKLTSELNEAKVELETLGKIRSTWENDDGDFIGTPAMWETYLEACEKYEAQLFKVQDLQSRIDDPGSFIKDADPTALANLESLLIKLVSMSASLNQEIEKVNQIVEDNRMSDEYQELVKQAETYKKQLADLNEKSKEMEFKGATDKQWENLRKETEWTSSKMDEVIDKMRKAVKTGKAFRFGEGSKSEFNNQINSFSMSAQNNAGYAADRAKKNQSPYTEDYQKSLDELDKLEKKIESIREKSAKMVELGASKKQFESLAYDAEQLDVKVDEVKNHLMNMVNEGGAFKFGTGDADAEISKIRDKSSSLQSTLTGVANNAKKAQGGLTALGATHPKLGAVLNVASKIGVGLGKVLKVAGKVAVGIAKGFAGTVKVLGNVARGVGRVASGFINLGKKIFSSIRNIKLFGKSGGSATDTMQKKFKKLTKNFLMFGLGFRTAYYAIKRLRNIFIEGFKVMGDQFDEIGQPMKEMMASFTRLKASLATAFQPLVSVVMPILTRFMNYLSSMLEAFGKFTATLTGQGHIYKAVAKDIDSVSGAAKDANKQLGSYDKLEVIQKNDTGYEYEKQDISATEDAASNFAQMVKKAWENADFTGVGQFVTEKLLGVLDTVEQSLVPKATGLVNKVLTSVNTFLQGFDATAIGDKIGSIINTLVSGIDWAQLGALFANINNTVWGFLDGLVNGIDWANLGQSVATGITSMFETLDLSKWVGMISGLINGITTALINVLTNVDWASVAVQLGTAVNNLFTSIDIGQIGTTISTLFSTLWTLVGNFFATVDWSTVATNIATGINNIFSGDTSAFESAAPAIADGLVTLFVTAITEIDWANIATVLVGGVQTLLQSLGDAMASSDNPIVSSFGSIVTAINECITILGPAVMAIIDAIGPIVQSILPIISELLPPIATIISEAVIMVMPVLIALFESLMPIIQQLVEAVLPVVLDLLLALQPTFDALINTVLPVIVHLLDACMPLIESILGLIQALLPPLLELLGPLIEIVFKIIDPLITILEPVISVLATLCDVIGAVLQPVLEALIPVFDVVNALFDSLGPIINIVMTPLNLIAGVFKFVASVITGILVPALKVLQTIIDVVANVAKMLANIFTTVFATIRKVIEDLINIIKKPINAILGGIEKMANGLIKAINGMVKAVNLLSFDVPDWVPGIGGKKFGFNLREVSEIKIPKLAQGAVIPPNKEFLAMLGDQKHGTNIEAPLDTIKQALAEVLAEIGGVGNKQPIVLQVNGRTLAQVVWDEQEKRYKQTGRYSPA